MEEKEKQILEMAKIICRIVKGKELKHCEVQCDIDCTGIAKELVNENYHKINENEVVVSKEKYILANKVYSDTTLKSWKKEDLIEHIRILEYNWASAEESLNNQAKNCEMLLKQDRKETAREIFKDIVIALTERHKGAKDFYGIKESVGVDMSIRAVKFLAEKYGVDLGEENGVDLGEEI